MAECSADVLSARHVVVDEDVGDVVVEGDLRGSTGRLAEALPADVVGDGDQPVLRLLGTIPLLDVRAVRVQEGRLRDVLGVRRIPHDRERVAVDIADVPLVHAIEGPVRTRSLSQQGSDALVVTCLCTLLRYSFTMF